MPNGPESGPFRGRRTRARKVIQLASAAPVGFAFTKWHHKWPIPKAQDRSARSDPTGKRRTGGVCPHQTALTLAHFEARDEVARSDLTGKRSAGGVCLHQMALTVVPFEGARLERKG